MRAEIEERLGPPADWFARARGSLVYPALGLRIGLDRAGALHSFEAFLDPEVAWGSPPGQARPFVGRWHPWGRPPTEAQLVALLGSKVTREADDREITLEWNGERCYVGADLSLEGSLRAVYVAIGE